MPLFLQDASARVRSSKSEQNTMNLNFVYTYVAYNYLLRRVQRNLMLIESSKHQLKQEGTELGKFIGGKYQEIVKLYDNILQVRRKLSRSRLLITSLTR